MPGSFNLDNMINALNNLDVVTCLVGQQEETVMAMDQIQALPEQWKRERPDLGCVADGDHRPIDGP
jgi:hypothetical protein